MSNNTGETVSVDTPSDIVPANAYKQVTIENKLNIAEMWFVQSLDGTELPCERQAVGNMWEKDPTDQPWLTGQPTRDLAVQAGVMMLAYWGRKTITRFTVAQGYVAV